MVDLHRDITQTVTPIDTGRRPRDYGPGRRCRICGRPLNRYNPGPCYRCKRRLR